jgi:hypothetical protein
VREADRVRDREREREREKEPEEGRERGSERERETSRVSWPCLLIHPSWHPKLAWGFQAEK